MGMSSIVDKQAVHDQLLPLFLQLLKDSNPDVRLNIISKLGTVNLVRNSVH